MANRVIVSEQFKLQARDFLKGALLAIAAAVAPIIQATLEQGSLTFNWKAIGITAIGTFVAYIGKNWLIEPAKVITTYSTNEKAVNVAEEIKTS